MSDKQAECENCGEAGTICDVCEAVSCPACREAVRASPSRCIQCNEIMPDVGAKGSCGTGSCDL